MLCDTVLSGTLIIRGVTESRTTRSSRRTVLSVLPAHTQSASRYTPDDDDDDDDARARTRARTRGSMGGGTPDRGDFATLNDADLAHFRDALGNDAVLTDDKSLDAVNEDWMRKYKGSSRVLLLPNTTEQVSAVMRHCNARRLAVVPQGGNTGLVGGGVPVHDEVVLGLKRMDRVVHVDASAGTVVAESGVVLEQLETELNRHGMTVPLDLGAKGKCQIGGNVSTNAGVSEK